MKQLIVLLAAVGLFASCSKEEPIAPATQKAQELEAPVVLTGEEAGEGQIRLSLRMEVENFEQVAGGFEDGQKARAVIPQINVGAANGNLIDLRAYADKDGRIEGMIYIYDSKKNRTVPFRAPFVVYNDGKSIGYDGLVSGFPKLPPGYTSKPDYRTYFENMVDRNMEDCFVTVVIGNNPGSLSFTNKGPYVINSWDDKVQLPANFVMMKSDRYPLFMRDDKGGKVHEITVRNNGRMKLYMMGYLMMLRIHNGFPQYVVRANVGSNGNNGEYIADGKRFRALRPPLFAQIDLSPTLSAAQDQKLTFDKGSIYSEPMTSAAYQINEENFKGEGGTAGSYGFARYKKTVYIPAGQSQPGDLPAKGDVVVAMYFPEPGDYGSVGFHPEATYGYDRSMFTKAQAGSNYYYGIKTSLQDKLVKSKPLARHGAYLRFSKRLDNKVYYPVIKVEPQVFSTPLGVSDGTFRQYQHWTNNIAKWEAIP